MNIISPGDCVDSVDIDFVCFKCFTSDTKKFSYEFRMTDDNMFGMDFHNALYVVCPKCNNIMTPIDKNLSDLICRFNKSGYLTLFCCEGHLEKRIRTGKKGQRILRYLSWPYIVFDGIGDNEKRHKFLEAVVTANEKVNVELTLFIQDHSYGVFLPVTKDSTYDNITYCFHVIGNNDSESRKDLEKFKQLKTSFISFLEELCSQLGI